MPGGVDAVDGWRAAFLAEHGLPHAYLDVASRYFDPLVHRLTDAARRKSATLVAGLNGSQGSGKSTLSDYLCCALKHDWGLTAVPISLDDVYLTRDQRQALAARVHPLLATRGVPGTHDLQLLRETIQALSGDKPDPVSVPSFDKSIDDRRPKSDWSQVTPPVDVILVEGWCLGARHEPVEALGDPLNDLERMEDRDGHWRDYVNEQLKMHLEPFYEQIDFWVMLAAPGFQQVLRWRTEQEEKLRAAVHGRGDGLMDGEALTRFVAHFERCTRQCLRDLPSRVDVLLQLDGDRNIVSVRGLGMDV